MLRIIQSQSSGQAKSYYSTADYYSEGQELEGLWRGQGADRLGLHGIIHSEDWDALCDNHDPNTGERLTLRQKSIRRVGYDFNFHVPKSVSLLHALTNDGRLLDQFREAVRETMDDIESEMQTRVRKQGQNEDRTTGNMVWGEFVHLTSRPVDGVPDPHLHAYCFVFNTTFDDQEQTWKAGQFGNLKRDANYFEAKFHVRLANKLTEIGLPIERTRTGWEISGFSKETLDKFSRRTEQIEKQARQQGITDAEKKSNLGAKTRERKQKDLTMDQLREEWANRLTDEERDSLQRSATRQETPPFTKPFSQIQEAIRNAADHVFERKSVIPERTLLAESLKRSVGQGTVEHVEQLFQEQDFLTKERHGRRMTTTLAVLSEERAMLDFARSGRGTCRPLGSGSHQFERTWLNEGQRNAVNHVLNSRDRVMVIRGAAGVGKTSMMQEAVAGIESNHRKVFTFAPTARASRGVLKEKGFANADTVARLLQDGDAAADSRRNHLDR